MSLKYFSMFSGIGGFELGIQNAYRSSVAGKQTDTKGNQKQGFQPTTREDISSKDRRFSERITNELNQRPLCAGYSEIDQYAIKVYERQFSGHKNYGDATGINPKDLPDFNLLVGGFPCQSFSVAGKRLGFNDTRGTLFFDIARILKDKRPRHLVLENVKGLLSHDQGKTFQTILGVLSDLGYSVEWQVLNSKNFGVPQNRERVYIVGHLGEECTGQIFPITGTDKQDTESEHTEKHCETCICSISEEVFNPDPESSDDHCETCTCSKILHNIYGGFNESKPRVFMDTSPTIRTSKGGGHLPSVLVREATKKGYAEATEGDSINISQPNSLTRRGRVGKGVVNTLETSQTQVTIQNARIRRLTPVECERLQGFPDNWTAIDSKGGALSDTQRYKMAGNAVTVNTVQAVMESLFKNCVV